MTDNKTQRETEIEKAERTKYELDPVQEYFQWNSDEKLLIDGVPFSQYLTKQKQSQGAKND